MKAKTIFLIALLTVSASSFSQGWTKAQLDKANTAKNISYLTKIEREAISFINLCRLYPKEFVQREVRNYKIDSAYGDSALRDFEVSKNSLIQELYARSSSSALRFDNMLYKDAKCYASEISKVDRDGHDRKDCKPSVYAECLSFGMSTGKDIVMQWLLDVGVSSNGHREICLDETLLKIGLSSNSHFKWTYCAVAEFE